jgi:hypothetical protein
MNWQLLDALRKLFNKTEKPRQAPGTDEPSLIEVLRERGSELALSVVSMSRKRSRQRRFVVVSVSALVLAAVALLDSFDRSTLAGHVVDLAKFVIPTLFASDAVIGYGESRLICCVLERSGTTASDEQT